MMERSIQWRMLEEEILRLNEEEIDPAIERACLWQLPESEVVEFITEFLYPQASRPPRKEVTAENWHLGNWRAAEQAKEILFSHQFVSSEIQPIVQRHLLAADLDRQGILKVVNGARFDDGILSLLKQRHATVSQLGSLCRQAYGFQWQYFRNVETEILAYLRANPNLPPEVAARILAPDVRSGEMSLRSRNVQQFQQQVAKFRPDLAGLPADMLLDIFEEQPVRAAWFVDVWGAPRSRYDPLAEDHPAWTHLLLPLTEAPSSL